jgi:lysyl-tRNA synthetase class 2
MNYMPVSSSVVSALAYEARSKTLGVRFHNGTEYHYLGVPREIFENMRSAPSIGQFLNESVKESYPFTRIA